MVALSTILDDEMLNGCMMKTNEYIGYPALGCKVGRAYQIMLSQLSEALNEAGLEITAGEYLVMRAVYSNPGIQQCEIADLVGKDKATVCRGVASLETKGLLRAEAVSYKCLKVYATEKGQQIEPCIMEVAAKRHNALMKLTSAAELEIFTRILDNIINSK